MIRGYSTYYFKRRPIQKIGDRYQFWRGVADKAALSAAARWRLEWMIFYYTEAKEDASKTARYFGISRKTFYKWFNRFTESKYDVKSLEDKGRRPHHLRTWEVSETEEARVINLRKRRMYYGKEKLKVLYKKEYDEDITCWKIERVIRKHKLFPDKIRAAKIAKKRIKGRENPKKRITELNKENRLYFLFQLDTIVLYWGNTKRYILTAVDHASKFGYARMYKNKSSKSASDFLYRLKYVISQPIENLQTDNGSEFCYYFQKACEDLNLDRYFSRVRTPKDNAECERFNQTLQYEWLFDSNLTLDCTVFNTELTNWLVEYNFNRPHQSLNYLTPVEYVQNHLPDFHDKVLPMWSATTS